MRQGMLAYGFVRGFKGSDTLLFLGDPSGVQKFVELLRSPREFGTRSGPGLEYGIDRCCVLGRSGRGPGCLQ